MEKLEDLKSWRSSGGIKELSIFRRYHRLSSIPPLAHVEYETAKPKPQTMLDQSHKLYKNRKLPPAYLLVPSSWTMVKSHDSTIHCSLHYHYTTHSN
ncbi:hypothetical protein F2Q70_00002317 [Brassica cretica]|uniref:Uncharacterized protein n=1 Tax=Brassica cretica TaxID=69181 RepID=A0A8S9ISQ8_BRACR|nr:hypothetical protein F2Q70_00002317 [Brassica cretica]